jgi:hypothetical protein
MISRRWFERAEIEVPVTVDIEKTAESFHAYAVPEGIDIRPGDEVVVHGAPGAIAFGERRVVACRATVRRAGLLRRAWTRCAGLFAITELYEVGFEAKEAS